MLLNILNEIIKVGLIFGQRERERERSYDEHGVQFLQCGDIHVEVSTLACGHYLLNQYQQNKGIIVCYQMKYNAAAAADRQPPYWSHLYFSAEMEQTQPRNRSRREANQSLFSILLFFLQALAPSAVALRTRKLYQQDKHEILVAG